jgi:hypothetical protein
MTVVASGRVRALALVMVFVAVSVAGEGDVAQAGRLLGLPSGVVVGPLERLPEQLVKLRLAERHLVVRHSLAL